MLEVVEEDGNKVYRLKPIPIICALCQIHGHNLPLGFWTSYNPYSS